MIQIEKMTEEMRIPVLQMVDGFYHSEAVAHPVPVSVMEQTFADAVGPDSVLTGYVMKEGEAIIGFAYVTLFYACEVGGRCLMFEELYIKEDARGKGYGTYFLKWIMEHHPEVKRFRLEVEDENKKAISLYEGLGFQFLSYKQMVRDLKEE